MPDIAMCKGAGCKRKEQCYRFTAEPDELRQTYFHAPPALPGEPCAYFLDAAPAKEKR